MITKQINGNKRIYWVYGNEISLVLFFVNLQILMQSNSIKLVCECFIQKLSIIFIFIRPFVSLQVNFIKKNHR